MMISSASMMGDYSKLPSGATETEPPAAAYDRIMFGIETTGFAAVFGYLFIRNLIKPIPSSHCAHFPIWILFQNLVIYHGFRRLIYHRFKTRREDIFGDEMSYDDLKLTYKSLIVSTAFTTLFMLAGDTFGCYSNISYPCSSFEWDRDIVIVLAFLVVTYLATGLTQLLVVSPEPLRIVRDEVEEGCLRALDNV